MSEDPKNIPPKKPLEAGQPAGPGELKKQEKERLEREISGSLEHLRGSLSRDQIAALIEKLAVAQARRDLEALKNDLENEPTLAGENMSDEARTAIVQLINDIQKATQLDIRELKLEVRHLNPSPHWEPLEHIYPTNKIKALQKLGESPLAKNIIIDVAGIVAGTLDSAAAVMKLLMTMIVDVFLLPRDLVRTLRKHTKKTGSDPQK